jgi:hypothetical protein
VRVRFEIKIKLLSGFKTNNFSICMLRTCGFFLKPRPIKGFIFGFWQKIGLFCRHKSSLIEIK